MFRLLPKRHSRNEIQVGSELERPWGSLARLRDDLDQLRERFQSQLPGWSEDLLGEHWGWKCDVQESEEGYVYRLESPGFEPDDWDISVQGERVTVKAERKEESKSEGGRQLTSDSYHRTFMLPPDVRQEGIEARYHSGILELHLPKDEQVKGQRIPVKAQDGA